MYVKNNLIEYFLPHFCQLLGQIDFKEGGPCYLSIAETMKGVMEFNVRGELVVHDPRHHLPQDIGEANAAEVSATLGNENGGLPYALFHEVSLLEIRLD